MGKFVRAPGNLAVQYEPELRARSIWRPIWGFQFRIRLSDSFLCQCFRVFNTVT
jgi:hypothetical protein